MDETTRPREDDTSTETAPPAPLSEHAARNVRQMQALLTDEEMRVGPHQRAIESVTAIVGTPVALYVVFGLVLVWTCCNAIGPHFGVRALDPAPFYGMQGVVGLAALVVSTMVLITQNRQSRLAELRAHLDLQMNILAEQKATKLVALLEELRHDLPSVKDRRDPEAETMAVVTDPRAIFQALDETMRAVEQGEGADEPTKK